MKIRTFIFDLDGTLFQTEQVAVPAFQDTFKRLKQAGIFKGDIPKTNEITQVFGLTTAEIWKKMLPDATDEQRAIADEWLLDAELTLLEQGVGQLYPSVKETLNYLRDQGVRLYIASNGGEPYIKGVVRVKGVDHYFDKIFFSAGEFKTSKKEELVKMLLLHNGDRQAVMVGDRKSDVRAGKANGLYVIGCDFGFAGRGELDEADHIIHTFDEIILWYDLAKQK